METADRTSATEGLTARLAQHVAGISWEHLPSEVQAAAVRTAADAFACGLAGSRIADDVIGPLRTLVADHTGGSCTSILHEHGLPATVAAFVNGSTIHTIDYDDTHMAVVSHFGASVVSAALAATQASSGDGRRFLEAIVAGFEAGARVGRACMPQHYQRWHATSSLGGIAAAAAAARAFGLDARGTEMAIGLAADDTGGTRVCIMQGDISKSLHAGRAAEKGVRAAQLVAAGAIGPVGLLEHEFGFFWAYSDERDARRLPEHLADMGTRWEILENDIKAHPCILSSHTAIEATLSLAREHAFGIDDVEEVRLFQPGFSKGHGMNRDIRTVMAARLSVPWCVMVGLADGAVGLAQFSVSRIADQELLDGLDRVTLEPDPDLGLRFPGQAPNRARITLRDGRVVEREVGIALGSHQRPFTDADHRGKLIELTMDRLGPEGADLLLNALRDAATGGRLDVLVELLTPGAASGD
jgi:2-methylcitrate dehydratase PrpD